MYINILQLHLDSYVYIAVRSQNLSSFLIRKCGCYHSLGHFLVQFNAEEDALKDQEKKVRDRRREGKEEKRKREKVICCKTELWLHTDVTTYQIESIRNYRN